MVELDRKFDLELSDFATKKTDPDVPFQILTILLVMVLVQGSRAGRSGNGFGGALVADV